MKKTLLFIAILCLTALAVVVFVRPHCEPQVAYRIVKQSVHDTIYVPVSAPSETVFVPVPQDVDTAQILQEYYSYNLYRDTVKINEYIEIAFHDTIYQNKLLSHNIDVLSLPKVMMNPNATTSRSVALGGVLGPKLYGVMADLNYKSHTFRLGFDFCNNSPLVGYSYRIKSW